MISLLFEKKKDTFTEVLKIWDDFYEINPFTILNYYIELIDKDLTINNLLENKSFTPELKLLGMNSKKVESVPMPYFDYPLETNVFEMNSYEYEDIAIDFAVNEWIRYYSHMKAKSRTPQDRYISTEALLPHWIVADELEKYPSSSQSDSNFKINYKKYDENSIYNIAILSNAKYVRNKQLSIEFCSFDNKYTEKYSTEYGLMPLVWAEILYSVNKNILINKCNYCNRFFPISKGKGYFNGNQVYCDFMCRRNFEKELYETNDYIKIIKKLRVYKSRAKTKSDKDEIDKEIKRLEQMKFNQE